jgi:hypothetical protein
VINPADLAIPGEDAELNFLQLQFEAILGFVPIPDPAILGNDDLVAQRGIFDELPGTVSRNALT